MNIKPETPWRGIYAAMLTPLMEDETLDGEACAGLACRLLDEGLAGLYLTGGTGEEYALDDEVRARLYTVTAQAAGGRGRLIAHIGGVPTHRALGLAQTAAEAGVDGLAALPPHGGRYTFDELFGYYREIAAAVQMPLFVYHIPAYSGYDLSLDELSRLLELPGVAGMKFTCPDLYLLERLIKRFPDGIFLYGTDEMLLPGLAAGAAGAIGSNYNLLGPVAVELAERFWEGDLRGARLAQAKINRFVNAKRDVPGGPAVLKALAGEIYGWKRAVSPSPAQMPRPEELKTMRRVLDEVLAPTEPADR
jgi:N-acetylneuraminate lyase